jgi:FkbM family methyltransferase
LKRVSLKDVARGLLDKLPSPAQRAVRRAYYARLLRSVDEEYEADLKLLKRVVAPGDSVVDIGASIGIYTKFLSALVGPEGHVYSVEPVPETYDVLTSNVRRLGLTNVRPLNYALSDSDGELKMEVPLWSHGGENLYLARAAPSGNPSGLRRITVESRKVDTLFRDVPIAFVKCDVEGHELRCLEGARGILGRSRPAWLLEVWGNPDEEGSHAREVFRAMESFGYGAHCYDGRRLEPRAGGRTTDNYWFLTADHLRALGEGRSR